MFDLFRFMVLRSPKEVDASATIAIQGNTELRAELKTASQGETPGIAMQQVAQRFTRTGDFVKDPSALAHWEQYKAVSAGLGQEPPLTLNGLRSLIKKSFQNDVQAVVSDKGFLNDKRRTQDSLVALQLTATPQDGLPDSLVQVCQVVDLIERVDQGDPSLDQNDALSQSLNRLIVLPADLFPVPSAPAQAKAQPPDGTAKTKMVPVQTGLDLINHAMALDEALRAIDNLMTGANPSAGAAGKSSELHALSGKMAKRSLPVLAAGVSHLSVIDPAVLQSLPPTVQSVLSNLNLNLSTTPLSAIRDQLYTVLGNTMNMMVTSYRGSQAPAAIGPDPFHEAPPPGEWQDDKPSPFPPPPYPANSQIKPRVADLLVVREHALGYQPGEIAFVENVATGEVFKRATRRKNSSETSTLTTTVYSTETERDLQSTNRFSLQRQSQSTIDENTSRVPGVGSSEAYGPLVDSGGSTQQASSQASEYGQDVTLRAVRKLTQSLQTQVLQQTNYEFDENVEHDFDNSRGAADQIVVYQWLDEIVQAKVFSYGKRVLYDFIVPEPAVFLAYGMTKWQPELTALQKPTLFSLEPGQLSANPQDANYYQYWAAGYGATGVEPPPEPTIVIAEKYGSTAAGPIGDQPAPGSSAAAAAVGVAAAGGSGGAGPENKTIIEVEKDIVTIQDGYRAKTAIVDVELAAGQSGGTLSIDIGQTHASSIGWTSTPITLSLAGEVGQIPLTVLADRVPEIYTVAIEIICERTEQYMAQWQAKTHDAILQASRDRLAEYEDRLNNLKAALQVKIAGKSSEEKQALIRAELEKSCISILTNQHFEAFNAIEFAPTGPGATPSDYMPQLFLPNVEPMGNYIRFFQQAFEWDQMLYQYYPYFWGRKKYWNDRLQLDDQDAEFAAFLSAGAARVTLPVRRGYEKAVAAFMNYGRIPSPEELIFGSITTGLYVPIFEEIMGTDGGPDTAQPYGDPPLEWEFRVPTTLVKIRTDNTLPKWANDTWTPVNPGDSENP